MPQSYLIRQLNPIIRGWTNYYAAVTAKRLFSKLDNNLFIKLKRWAKRRHANKSWSWVYRKYWRRDINSWDFAPKDGQPLYQHVQTPIKRHIKVRNTKSPYDGDWVYWVKRRGRQPGIPRRVATLLKQQAGKCASCGLYIHVEDKLEVDHIIPKSKGGKDGYHNWQLLHAHCHHRKTAEDADLQRLEVLMATASRMRSRMRLASHVRF